MKIIGIVAEYNPFHNGHLYQIETIKSNFKPDGVVVVMSGNFVQRGEPAILDKWTRAKLAIQNGVDLVLELPTYYATASAEDFARGAVKTLIDTGIVTHICFGSETDNLEQMIEIASVLTDEPQAYKLALASQLALGLPYPKARENALSEVLVHGNDTPQYVNQSNAILGIEYLKALKFYQSDLQPIIVKRMGDDYRDETIHSHLASATAIRKSIFNEDHRNFLYEVVPNNVSDLLMSQTKDTLHRLSQYEALIRYAIKLHTPESLTQIRGIREGLENKFIEAERKTNTLESFYAQLKSKRYTMTSLTRIGIAILLNIHTQAVSPNYLRVLGFSTLGQGLLKKMKTRASREIVTTLSKASDSVKENSHMKLDLLATDLYQMPTTGQSGMDFTTMPFQEKQTQRKSL